MSDAERIKRLESILARAHHALANGYIGGEWANLVPDPISYAASKEHDEALEAIDLIREELGWNKAEQDTP